MSMLPRVCRNSAIATVAGVFTLTQISIGSSIAQESPTTKLASLRPSVSENGSGRLLLGAYDPHGTFKDVVGLAIEHIYIPWKDVNLASLNDADKYALARGRELLITVEPWSWSEQDETSPEVLRAGILSGHYDDLIQSVCAKTSELKSRVTLRWGHEMDLPSTGYPWAQWTPTDYIVAYRHFVDTCRRYAPTQKFMWSPRGEVALAAYYPGDAYVDSIGLSIFGLQAYDEKIYGKRRSFNDIVWPSYKLIDHCRKPVIIAELGYSGDQSYQETFRRELINAKRLFRCIKAVVFYNDVERVAWPHAYGLPDWRVAADAIPTETKDQMASAYVPESMEK